jgi:hypothetical protein
VGLVVQCFCHAPHDSNSFEFYVTVIHGIPQKKAFVSDLVAAKEEEDRRRHGRSFAKVCIESDEEKNTASGDDDRVGWEQHSYRVPYRVANDGVGWLTGTNNQCMHAPSNKSC